MINWFVANWEVLAGILGLVVALGTAVAKLTSTTKDDAFFGWLGRLLGRSGGADGSSLKGGAEDPLIVKTDGEGESDAEPKSLK